MSAFQVFSSIQFKDKECLIAALEALGYQGKIEVHDEPQHLYGYEGRRRPEKAEVIIRRKHIGFESNDVGFALVGFGRDDGAYVPIISDYDRRYRWGDDMITRLKVEYAQAAVNKIIQQKRATVLNKGHKAGLRTIRVRLYAR